MMVAAIFCQGVRDIQCARTLDELHMTREETGERVVCVCGGVVCGT